ncbi:hypothetical protein CYMTET_21447 [Cymbomonas tetramitiformis]|uniref:Uncharacterized protein n=1 Tax=Cymbomonas tetramitiformis TaxID=36881 RepID=A0AAE0G249_9CHLO|nr:hypothetical protein CYMTET_21447 [Cymbomonas tetramitiformis]
MAESLEASVSKVVKAAKSARLLAQAAHSSVSPDAFHSFTAIVDALQQETMEAVEMLQVMSQARIASLEERVRKASTPPQLASTARDFPEQPGDVLQEPAPTGPPEDSDTMVQQEPLHLGDTRPGTTELPRVEGRPASFPSSSETPDGALYEPVLVGLGDTLNEAMRAEVQRACARHEAAPPSSAPWGRTSLQLSTTGAEHASSSSFVPSQPRAASPELQMRPPPESASAETQEAVVLAAVSRQAKKIPGLKTKPAHAQPPGTRPLSAPRARAQPELRVQSKEVAGGRKPLSMVAAGSTRPPSARKQPVVTQSKVQSWISGRPRSASCRARHGTTNPNHVEEATQAKKMYPELNQPPVNPPNAVRLHYGKAAAANPCGAPGNKWAVHTHYLDADHHVTFWGTAPFEKRPQLFEKSKASFIATEEVYAGTMRLPGKLTPFCSNSGG